MNIGVNRNGKKKLITREEKLDKVCKKLEGEVLSLKEGLKKAQDETRQMKRINKELLDQLNLN